MSRSLKVAVAKTPISSEPEANGRIICQQMQEAKEKGARLILFPEGALSGYVKSEITDWANVDWDSIDCELQRICNFAAEIDIWVVVGTASFNPAGRPFNSLVVVSSQGRVAARYDKCALSNTENRDWFTPGTQQTIVNVDGIRIGFALCIELIFPQLFESLAMANADIVLVGTYGLADETLASALASFNCLFVAVSVPANARHTDMHSVGFGPDGSVLARCDDAEKSPVVFDVCPDDKQWEMKLLRARPWRQSVVNTGRLKLPVADQSESGPMVQPNRPAQQVELVQADLSLKPVIEDLYKPYIGELSAYIEPGGDDDNIQRLSHGPYFDLHWTEPDRDAFLLTVSDAPIGFALTRQFSGDTRELCEFYVLPRFRRAGHGHDAANLLFSRHPGRWRLSVLRRNTNAIAFWPPCLAGLKVDHLKLSKCPKNNTVFEFSHSGNLS